jgi:hypothetical protein
MLHRAMTSFADEDLRVHKLIISLTAAILGEQEQKHEHRANYTPM